MDRREKERKERTKVEFVSGTVKKPSVNPAPAVTGGSSAAVAPGKALRDDLRYLGINKLYVYNKQELFFYFRRTEKKV